MGKENKGRKLTLSGFEAHARATRTTNQGNEPQPIPVIPGDMVNGASVLSGEQHDAQPIGTNGSTTNTEGPRSSHRPSPLRLYVTTERIWQALTGHGLDTKRVPELEFKLLSVIASSGREGILQAELVKASGQDKRSVPKRTDNLHDKGYIEKRGVLTKGARTSICILKQYAKQTGVPGTGKTVDALANVVFQHGRLVYDNFLDFITALLKDRKIITFEDLREILVSYPVLRILVSKLNIRRESQGRDGNPKPCSGLLPGWRSLASFCGLWPSSPTSNPRTTVRNVILASRSSESQTTRTGNT